MLGFGAASCRGGHDGRKVCRRLPTSRSRQLSSGRGFQSARRGRRHRNSSRCHSRADSIAPVTVIGDRAIFPGGQVRHLRLPAICIEGRQPWLNTTGFPVLIPINRSEYRLSLEPYSPFASFSVGRCPCPHRCVQQLTSIERTNCNSARFREATNFSVLHGPAISQCFAG
jgi:hypothetical protein